jgi:HAD superfamily hydrolase (TIGR01509 family)
VIKALIFDFDGLILDTESSLVEAWQELYNGYGFELPLDDWAKILGQSSDPPEAYAFLETQIGEALDRSRLKRHRVARELAILQDQRPLPGIENLIQEAQARGLSLGVASSSEHIWVDHHLERLGLIEAFDVIVCADDVSRTKPAPDLYLQALRSLKVSAREAIAFEDSEHGVHAAVEAGLFTIAVPNAITKAASFDHAALILDSLGGVTLDDVLEKAATH